VLHEYSLVGFVKQRRQGVLSVPVIPRLQSFALGFLRVAFHVVPAGKLLQVLEGQRANTDFNLVRGGEEPNELGESGFLACLLLGVAEQAGRSVLVQVSRYRSPWEK
jgi:hypothetical protein